MKIIGGTETKRDLAKKLIKARRRQLLARDRRVREEQRIECDRLLDAWEQAKD